MLIVTKVRCEYKENPIGISLVAPRISWQLLSDIRNCVQMAYRIQVSKNADFHTILWDTGTSISSQSIHVQLTGLHLQPKLRYYYRVKVWDQTGAESAWSSRAFFETGLEDPQLWPAQWISAPSVQDSGHCPRLRQIVNIDKAVRSARIYATALGLYELHLNNQRVGDQYFTPGWTSYGKRLQYQTYEVTDMLHKGTNVLGALLGDGWYKGYLGWKNDKEMFGTRTALLLELHIQYEDGTEDQIMSGPGWESSISAIVSSDIYMGETYDARLEREWTDSDGWIPADIIHCRKDIIVAQENVPVLQQEQLKPMALFQTPQGDTVLDMGQNMVGWLRFAIHGSPGQKVELEHAEILDAEGNFYRHNIRSAAQRIVYTLRGDCLEEFKPHFTFQGFRYVKLTGFSGKVQLDHFIGVVLHSNMERTGHFECSSPLVNQLHHNILWGQKGNFLDVPTDCPQRDERLGWTGDAQMFVKTASYLMNTAPFFTKWLRDLKADQTAEGGVPFFIPNLKESFSSGWGETDHSSAAWGDAATICPWTIYEMYGDTLLLQEQYESMKKWVSYIQGQGDNPYLWNTGFHFGDWLALDSEPGSYIGSTDIAYIATAFYAYSVSLTQKAADALGKTEDSEQYHTLHTKVVEAFQNEYVTASGDISISTQTAQVLALRFGLIQGSARERAIRKLEQLLHDAGDHLKTGFVGTPYLNPVLSECGNNNLAYKLLFQKDYPSWLYQVTKGATTVWEHWDGIKEDGSFWSADMNSFNHYAYGAIGDWLYGYVAGIGPDENNPGFKVVHIHPHPGPGLDWAEASIESMYGTILSSWRRTTDHKMTVTITVPANTEGVVILPGAERILLLEGVIPAEQADGVKRIEAVEQGVRLVLGSGTYRFVYPQRHA
ncbi:alpha-L-rhamnosidase [Paenibacillus sp. OK003]|uniref:alpha-L-rhamnosidase n=1 Tax=Paenibacillus sp. OK003 TaxID=1884380 RepID=UPI0008C65998|nr:alpha-L-rhamnosidase [Paenibacillus sp. OK003]SEL81798.1 alpha-L-rhamnosidase [Paenibacillus sp. OK003]